MKKESLLKRALIVTGIASIVFIVTFAILFVLAPLVRANSMGLPADNAIASEVNAMMSLFAAAFYLPFDSVVAAKFAAVEGLSETAPLTLSVISYVLSGIAFICLVLGIIYICTKKKIRYLAYIFPYLIAVFVALLVISLGGYFNFQYIAMSSIVEPHLSGVIVMAIFILIIGCLAFLSMVATVVLGLIMTHKEQVSVAEEIEEAEPTLAEEAEDPEATVEPEQVEEPAEANIEEAEVEEIPVVDEESMIEEEDIPEVEAEPEEEPKEEAAVEEEPEMEKMDKESLTSLLKEVVRDIVRDEMARNNVGNQSVMGATFGAPLVVQYFNGSPVSTSGEEKKEEEAKAESAPAITPLFTKRVPNIQPVKKVEEKPSEEKKYERISFAERLLQSEKDVHELYNELKNEILSYGVKSRISAVGDTFRLHKKMYVRITVAGKSLKLYFALNPDDYADSTLPIQDASNKEMYVDIPLVFKVKSALSVRRAKELIQDVMDKDGLEQGEIGKVNWVKELKAELASGKKLDKED